MRYNPLDEPHYSGPFRCPAGPAAQADPHSGGDAAEGRRLYTSYCAACHGVEGENVPGVDLKSGQFRRVNNDRDLAKIINEGIPGTAMPPSTFTPPQISHLVVYVRSLKTAPVHSKLNGDTTRGQAIFEGRGGCLKCHQAADKGSRVGPDLNGIGKLRSASALETSILDPNKTVLPQHRYVRAITKQGLEIFGRKLNEDTLTLQLIDSSEQLLSLSKDSLRDYVVLKTSPMPSYKGTLTTEEVTDLISYLVSLK